MNQSFLTSRLRDLVGGAVGHAGTPREPGPSIQRSLEQVTRVLGGEVCAMGGGCCIIVDRWYPAETVYGDLLVGRCAEIMERHIDHLPLLGGVRLNSASSAKPSILFFDLETTGLAGGAGTYAFLVGCGGFVDGSFHTRQFFLTGYGAERPLLAAVAEWMAGANLLVSFNGRTFDAPVLETRYLFHRVAVPFADLPHIDMLHAARRLWRSQDGCSLRVIEEMLAGIARQGDIPGVEIPARYVHYARTGDARLLVPVFEHNRLDLLSLAMVTAVAMRLVEHGAPAARNAGECLGLGRVYERGGLRAQAAACYAAASRHTGALEVRIEAMRRLADCLRRERRYEEAADAWGRILTLRPSADARAREAARALAVHHEHRSKDLQAARAFAVRAAAAAASHAHRAAAQHRLARLNRKLERGNGNSEGALPL